MAGNRYTELERLRELVDDQQQRVDRALRQLTSATACLEFIAISGRLLLERDQPHAEQLRQRVDVADDALTEPAGQLPVQLSLGVGVRLKVIADLDHLPTTEET